MSACETCGTEVSFFNLERECETCRKRRLAEEAVERAEKARLQAAEEHAIKEEAAHQKNIWINQRVADFAATLTNEAPRYLVQQVYRPVDSVIEDDHLASQFVLGEVELLGAYGWQIVGIIPRTVGTALKNISFGSTNGTTWGAGMGGNIAGVYVLMQLAVTKSNYDAVLPSIRMHFGMKYRPEEL
jgi:hypothetical protein